MQETDTPVNNLIKKRKQFHNAIIPIAHKLMAVILWLRFVFVLQYLRLWSNIDLLTAELFNWNFHPLEVVSRSRDPQLQLSENYSDLRQWRSTIFKSRYLVSRLIFNILFKRW